MGPIERDDRSHAIHRKGAILAASIYIWPKGIAYDPRRTKNPAKDFAQLWDVKNFPERRSLPDLVPAPMEVVLLADGVPPSKLHPLDVSRARLQGAGSDQARRQKVDLRTQLMISMNQSNEADYSYVVANRVKAANDAGVSIDFPSIVRQGAGLLCRAERLQAKGSEAVMRWIEFICRPLQQALVANKLSLLGVVRGMTS